MFGYLSPIYTAHVVILLQVFIQLYAMKLFGFLFLVPFVLATEDDNSVGNENCVAQTDAGRVQCILQKSPRKRYEVEYYPCIPYAKPVARFGVSYRRRVGHLIYNEYWRMVFTLNSTFFIVRRTQNLLKGTQHVY